MADVAVVVVNFDSGPWLARCLASVAQQQPAPSEVVVIDNASTDGSARGLSDDVKIVQRSVNGGFGAGVRDGFARTSAPFVLVLNPDVLLEPGALAAACATLAADETLGSVALRVHQASKPEHLDATGIGLTSFLGQINWDHDLRDQDVPEVSHDVLGPLGGAALWRRAAVDAVGGMRTSYFLYWEDMDLSLRLLGAGYGCRTVPAARAAHATGASVGHMSFRNVFYMVRNHAACLIATLPGPMLRRHWPACVLAPLRAAWLYAGRGQPLAALLGWICGALTALGAWTTRAELVGDPQAATERLVRLTSIADDNRLVMRRARNATTR